MELFNLTAHELRDMLRDKKINAVELTKAYFDRISQVEDKVKSYLNLCEVEALASATKIQTMFDKGEKISELAGIPIALKDNLCTKGVKTSCASKMLENFVPPYDATVVKKLKDSGTIMLGKVNMDEFAMGGSTEHSFFKKTANPWDLSRVPGGSSGGAAAAVSAGEAVFSIGSDTGGSIRQPAMFCGVVGMKPTYGAVSRYGLVAFASSLDQIGPLTKDVTDCALVMNAICGYDNMDSTSVKLNYPDYTKYLVNDVKGMKIGVPKEFIHSEGLKDDIRESIVAALEQLKGLGAQVEEFDFPINEYAIPAYYIIACAEASSNLARYDGIKYGYRAEKFGDLLDLYKQSRSEGFGPEVMRRIMLGTYALSSGYYDAYYKKALQVRSIIHKQYMNAFSKYDLIAGPVSPSGAFKFGEKTDNPLEMYLVDMFTVAVNIAGLPGVSIPCGFDSNGMPNGLQLIGKPFDEGTLLRAGFTYEQNNEWHKMRAKL